MKIPFRQGLVRYQTDIVNTPTFIQHGTGNKLTLYVSPDQTIVTFAHGPTTNYLLTEEKTIVNAWQGPFVTGTDYYIFWDINSLTAERTFGHTIVPPVFGPTAPSPVADKHWFDTVNCVMNVWNGTKWIEKIRVFAGKYQNGSIIIPHSAGSQVGLSTSILAGFILFDDEDNAVKKFDRFGRGKFITTESYLTSQSSKLANFRIESQLALAQAVEHVPKFACVCYKGLNKIGLASFNNINQPAVGIATEDLYISETRTFLREGFLRDDLFAWTQPENTPLFVGSSGELTTNVPQVGSIQQVAYIVDDKTICIDIHPLIILDES
jgi:hypothetical protein